MFISKTTAAVLAMASGMFLAGPAYAGILLVPDEYPTIQAAIDAASDGDEIIVAPGKYVENINFLGKAVTVSSSDGPDVTTLVHAVSDCCFDSGNPGCDDPECEAQICEADPACCEEWDDICATAALESCQICNGSVVTCASGEGSATVLDGFTITAGTGTDDGSGNLLGGGMYNLNSSPTVTNCTFYGNSATDGGGMYCANSSPTIDNCLFTRNTANAGASSQTGRGGAIAVRASSSPVIENCTFIDNEAVGGSFTSTGRGGGLFIGGFSDAVLRNCTLVGNIAIAGTAMYSGFGGGILTFESHAELTNCIFIGNKAIGASAPPTVTGAGGGFDANLGTSTLTNCIFAGNAATGEGYANGAGGAIKVYNDALLTNCAIIGNSADFNGGGLWIDYSTLTTLTNCTLSGNSADSDGDGVGSGGGIFSTSDFSPVGHAVATFVDNSIVWDNGPNPIVDEPGFLAVTTVTYSDVQGGWSGAGENNIDADPLFDDGPSGTWTADGVYDEDTGQTTWTEPGAAWKAGALVGMFINPNTDQPLQSFVAANTATTITVWAKFSDLGIMGKDYQIRDYHLTDGSPCIDAADNTAVPSDTTDLDADGDTDEPIPFDLDGNPRFVNDLNTQDTGVSEGGCPVVDMGAYEYQDGTMECCPADFDGDGAVGAFDLALLLGSWGPYGPCPPFDAADFNEDCAVNAADLAQLLGDWGECE